MADNVIQQLFETAERYPEKIALSDEKHKYTFSEYRDMASRIGEAVFKKCGGKRGRAVPVLIDRNAISIIAFLGVAISGNYYVPVDPAIPKDRIKCILDICDPLMIIDASEKPGKVEGAVALEELIEGITECDDVLSLVTDISKNDPLCVIFTSGSTGIPKGVIKSHGSVLAMCRIFSECFGYNEDIVFGNQAAYDFDVSTKDIYNALFVGARVEILAKKLFKFPKLLLDQLRSGKINTLMWAAAAVRMIAELECFRDEEVPQIKNVLFSGEQLPVSVLSYWKKYLPECRFVNLYGPTEISGNATYYIVDREYDPDERLPIGKPFKNTRVFLLKDRTIPVDTPGERAEICFSGDTMASGYLNAPEATAAAFIDDPLERTGGVKVYATGDLGYYNGRGELVFAGREDSQIKHMGHRIELSEVENAVNSCKEVELSCCLYDTDNKKIICFYQAAEECKKSIIKIVSDKLPRYMWPAEYVYFKKLPVNRTLKTDRVLLKQMIKEGTYDGRTDKDNE